LVPGLCPFGTACARQGNPAAWRWPPGRPPAGSLLGMRNGDARLNPLDPAVSLLVLTERLASGAEREDAAAAAAMAEYRVWSAAGRPGAISHAAAKRLLLGESG
jgi:hypothetical protein